MNILLVNDDGIESPNLLLLCRCLAARGHDIYVCAPRFQQSAKSHSLTIDQPILAHKCTVEGAKEAWSIEGTPADCTRIGIYEICSESSGNKKPDLVVSGINHGYNVGVDTYASGTIAAAREAAFNGCKAMALSAHFSVSPETLSFFAEYCADIAEKYVDFSVPPQSVLSLNVPNVSVSCLKEPVMVPLAGAETYSDNGYEMRVSPRGCTYFWITEYNENRPCKEGCDVDMLKKGHITCSLITYGNECQGDFSSLLNL